ncbi:uncharacterized protein BKA55DRAFT_718210 [Fusarium redolens]|uniref:Aminoglycoside phosphotransferase domain-containing protein n=1 Tax=Fusarium redolens TaxID=48865 RepID=A0A9P9HXQ5_FUSRE|nr:uncharacterized protein BKA55DRAFT_718210 [Fusarium redolens]KAH7264862.1 hypothetical protein BKA55DRAFT_718210 [Fusarium redolens]
MTKARQNFDHLAWSLNEEAWKKSYKRLRLKSTCRQVESFVQDVCDQHASFVPPVTFGGYNVLYRVRCEGDGFDTIVRRPCPDLVQFPAEKTLYEAATMSYLAKHTEIPVPMLFFYTSSSSSSEIGPAMILPYIESRRNMSDALAKPDQDPEETQVLDPGIHEEDLIRLYWKMCKLLIQLFKPSLDKIGSLVERNENHSVAGRPITQNMDDMVYMASIPRSVFPPSNQVYQRADEWYTVSASMHMAQLLFQHNDLVQSEDDCRNKYVARYLFHSLAKKGQLSTFGFLEDNWSAQSKFLELSCPMPNRTGSFRLWCDDLRPHNILLNLSDNIEAALD